MRVSRAEAAENRMRVIEVASKLFRQHGFDGIGVADLMKAAGLTHGGFYGNFASKDRIPKAFNSESKHEVEVKTGDPNRFDFTIP